MNYSVGYSTPRCSNTLFGGLELVICVDIKYRFTFRKVPVSVIVLCTMWLSMCVL